MEKSLHSKPASALVAQPILRWAGSKRKLLPHLRKYWQDDSRRYVEPFTGSACLFFDLTPSSAILADINHNLIETYSVLRDSPRELHEETKKIPKTKEDYYLVRNQTLESLSRLEKAARFIYLNRYCFNGLYRTNLHGKFNVPYGGERSGNVPILEVFIAASEQLKKAQLVTGDFENIVSTNLKSDDFIYLDPPYAVKNKKIFTQYDACSFGLDDLNRLSVLLDKIDSKGAKFVLSYACCEESKEYFGKWNCETVDTQRNISGFASHRKIDQEIIITNL
jgi:DNA adenine methylase